MLSYSAPWFPAMEGIDWEAEARMHFDSIGLDVPRFEERMLCCKIHLGLCAQQWNVYTKDWDEVERHATRTLGLVRE
jgi:hypothetical protein